MTAQKSKCCMRCTFVAGSCCCVLCLSPSLFAMQSKVLQSQHWAMAFLKGYCLVPKCNYVMVKCIDNQSHGAYLAHSRLECAHIANHCTLIITTEYGLHNNTRILRRKHVIMWLKLAQRWANCRNGSLTAYVYSYHMVQWCFTEYNVVNQASACENAIRLHRSIISHLSGKL